ncbi:MAG TPA: four helix bundle protein, partial [Candidatus Angelobacter sp.]|nr:four helix bundle protein [Candidatus Angelobacter sp.]
EGCGRVGDGDFHRFLATAMGSAVEVEYFLLLARDLGLIDEASYKVAERGVMEVQRMLGSLVRKVGEARTRK